MNIAGIMAKYFATSLAIENVVSAPRVISNCLPISTISISLVGSLSRSTMLPASRAAMVPVFIATPTSACASAVTRHKLNARMRDLLAFDLPYPMAGERVLCLKNAHQFGIFNGVTYELAQPFEPGDTVISLL